MLVTAIVSAGLIDSFNSLAKVIRVHNNLGIPSNNKGIEMLTFNGKTYAKSDKEFTESLFKPVNGMTCNGFYRKVKGGIKLFRQNWVIDAFIVDRQNEKFVVSAGMHNGKTFYMFGLNSNAESWLGLSDKGMADTYSAIASITID